MTDADFRYTNAENSLTLYFRKHVNNIQSRHFHNQFEVFYLIRGERIFFIKDRSYDVRAGDLVIIRPNIIHRGINTTVPGCDFIGINFEDTFLPSLYPITKVLKGLFDEDSRIISLSANDQMLVQESLFEIMEELQNKSIGFEQLIQAVLTQFLIFLCRYIKNNDIIPLSRQRAMNEKISEIVDFINNNYYENISLVSLSKQFYISPSYLSKLFKESTSFSFVEYLNYIRVREAKKFLTNTNIKVSAISENVGFGSVTHFGRVFKEVTGKPPLYFRKNVVKKRLS